MKEDFLEHIKSRGYLHQCTNEIGLKKTLKNSTSGYIGFDCTSDSLHIGSLLPLMLLKVFQKFGHKPIVLIGGGTTLIGDPSGKDETRKILTEDEITKNKKKLKKIFEKFVSFDKSLKNHAVIVDNLDWLQSLKFIPFVRDIGSKFSVNRMLGLESTKQRLTREQNLSFLEFNYSIIQAYDFLELNKKNDCQIQFGGSDQWGNIISGIELIKKERKKEVFGLTTHLITNSDGTKMGKTAKGAIWLSDEKLSANDFWQFWRNTLDEDVIKFLKLFTEVPNEKINKFNSYDGSEINELKILLANEITGYCHGNQKAKKAQMEAEKILTTKNIDSELIENCEKKIIINENNLESGFYLKQVLVDLKLSESNSESKRLVKQGAIKINETIINEKEFKITRDHFIIHPKKNNLSYLIIYVGKKKYGLVELVT